MESNKIVKLEQGNFGGAVKLPPSKSLSHRYIIGAALSKGCSVIRNIANSEDIKATLKLMEILGAKIKESRVNEYISDYEIIGNAGKIDFQDGQEFFCNESGSTIRFIIPLLLLSENEAKVTGAGKLVERPQDTYYKLFIEKEIYYRNTNGMLPLYLKGKLESGEFRIAGNVSSQFITGLLYTLPLLAGDSVIEITTELESKPYIDLTLQALRDFGIEIKNEDYKRFIIKGNQEYKAIETEIEGDLSQLAFFAVLGVISDNDIEISGIKEGSFQGDGIILDIIKDMGGIIEKKNNSYIFKKSNLKATTIDVRDCPDLVPALGLLTSMAEGKSNIINAERLRIKESDRLEATRVLINTLGGDIKEIGDSLEINGVSELKGGNVSSFNDHRIAMTAAMARVVSKGDIYLEGYEAVAKSFVNFFEVYESLGGKVSYE